MDAPNPQPSHRTGNWTPVGRSPTRSEPPEGEIRVLGLKPSREDLPTHTRPSTTTANQPSVIPALRQAQDRPAFGRAAIQRWHRSTRAHAAFAGVTSRVTRSHADPYAPFGKKPMTGAPPATGVTTLAATSSIRQTEEGEVGEQRTVVRDVVAHPRT